MSEKKRILIVPLDERPCNYDFSHLIFEREENLIKDIEDFNKEVEALEYDLPRVP